MNQRREIATICVNCRFHDPERQGDYVFCRRHAPTCSDHFVSDRSWPHVKLDDWCGEFEPYHNRPPKPPWEE